MKSGKESVIERSCGRKNITQKAFEPGPEFFDRVEFRGIRWEEDQFTASILGKRNKPFLGMEGSVVHHNHGAFFQGRDGSLRLCRYLIEQGIRNKEGKNIPINTITRIVKNPIYIGIICNGESKSEILPNLQIIDPELFTRAQEIMEKRGRPHSGVPLTTRGQSLLVDNIFCGHCGGHLILYTSGQKYKRKAGTVKAKTYGSYQCSRRLRRPGVCDGQSCYSVTKVDNLVDQIVRIQLERVKKAPPQALIKQQQNRALGLAKARLKMLNDQYRQKQCDYQALREEMLKVVQGTSRLNVDMLNSLIDETNAQLKNLEQQISEAEVELQKMEANAEQVQSEYTQLMNWAELYDNCTFDAKKMIVAQFVKAVHVKRGFELDKLSSMYHSRSSKRFTWMQRSKTAEKCPPCWPIWKKQGQRHNACSA